METKISAQIIGLKEDLNKEYRSIKNQTNYALTEVGVELQSDLISAIKRDWYSKYTPAIYKRRTDNQSLGTPLGDESNFAETHTSKSDQTLYFAYNPTGEHRNTKWNDRSGDSLIEWIQREHEYKDEESGEPYLVIPARPFWNNFIDEQIDGGIMDKFIRAMSPVYNVLEDERDKQDLESLSSESYLAQDF